MAICFCKDNGSMQYTSPTQCRCLSLPLWFNFFVFDWLYDAFFHHSSSISLSLIGYKHTSMPS